MLLVRPNSVTVSHHYLFDIRILIVDVTDFV